VALTACYRCAGARRRDKVVPNYHFREEGGRHAMEKHL